MLLVSWSCVFMLKRKKDITPILGYALLGMTFSGWVATVAGWYVTEIGRQPWLVSGVLRVADAVTPVPAPMVGLTLVMYLIVYALLLVAFMTTLFYMARRAGEKIADANRVPVASGEAIVEALQ